VDAASSSVGMPSPATALFTRAIGGSVPVLPRAVREAPLAASTCCVFLALPESFRS
jgi:hypothetical protein